jgi:hypothetical protein
LKKVNSFQLCDRGADVFEGQHERFGLDAAGYVSLIRLRSIPKIMIAFDNNQADAEMAERLKQDLPQSQVKTPQQKDWNGHLQEHLSQVQQQLMQNSQFSESNSNSQKLK